MSDKWKCVDCEHICSLEQMLVAPHPFDPDDVVRGCPDCKEINTMMRLCDVPGCARRAGCGTFTPDGYRHTCYEHRPNKE